MATQLNDVTPVQRGTVNLAGGNDTYILAGSLIDANAEITIMDTQGTNRIQLIEGLNIVSSIVMSDTAQLTLNNGAVINILGASNFTYEIMGNPLTGQAGTVQTYTQLVQNTLHIANFPTTGQAEGTQVTIGSGQIGTYTDVAVDGKGSLTTAVTLDPAGTAAFNYIDTFATANNVVIDDFGSDDKITITGVAAVDGISTNAAGDVTIISNNNGSVSQITLLGVATPGTLGAYDLASFNALSVGDLVFG